MRVLFNGASAIRPKTGVGHTTANLHRALVRVAPRDSFWLYPGERVRNLAARFFKPPPRPTGSVSPPKPATPSLPRRLALRAARLDVGRLRATFEPGLDALIARRAVHSIRQRSLDIHVLMLAAVVGAIALTGRCRATTLLRPVRADAGSASSGCWSSGSAFR